MRTMKPTLLHQLRVRGEEHSRQLGCMQLIVGSLCGSIRIDANGGNGRDE